MATQIARNDCPAVAQVTNITPTVTNNLLYDLKINTKQSDTYTADGSATAQEIVEGLQALLAAETIIEYTEIAWTEDDTKIIATGQSDGEPFTVTDGAGSGTWASITTVTTPKGPNHWIAENFSAGTLPASGEDIVLTQLSESQSFYWSLDQNAVQLASLDLRADSNARIGLPERNTSGGDAYYEYRATHLLIDTLVLRIGDGVGEGARSLKIKLTGATACDVTVYRTSVNPLDPDEAPVHLAGGNAANTFQMFAGAVDIAMLPSYTATYATLTVSGGTLRLGAGVTVTTIDVAGGVVESRSAVATYRVRGDGKAVHIGASNITTLDLNGAMEIQATGALTVGTLSGYGGKQLDLSKCDGAVTVTNATIYATPSNPFTVLDPNNKLVMTNPWSTPNGAQSLRILSGSGRNVRVT